jgi:hypothetical protein
MQGERIFQLPMNRDLFLKHPMPTTFFSAGLEHCIGRIPGRVREEGLPQSLYFRADKSVRPKSLQLQSVSGVEEFIVFPTR